MRARALTILAVMLLASSASPGGARAQQNFHVAAASGPTLNDLETGGPLWLGALSLEWHQGTIPLVVDASVRYTAFTAAEREHYPLLEISAQWTLPEAGPVAPFIGTGAGLAWRIRPSETDWDPSTHVTAGFRASLSGRLGLRAEARFRSLEPLADLTLGLTWTLGG